MSSSSRSETPSVDILRDLVAYTYWGRDRVLRAADSLTEEQLRAPTWLDYGTILATMVHQLAAEVLMRQRWEGTAAPRLLDETNMPTYEALKQRWLEQGAAVQAFATGLTDDDLEKPVRYVSRSGAEYAEPLWQLLFQTVNHGTQHRSEVALALTQLGASPGFLDYLAYVRERNAG